MPVIQIFLYILVLVLAAFWLWTYRKYKKMEISQKAREDYVAMMVHDIRSPLSVIKGASDILLVEKQHLSAIDTTKLLTQVKTTSEALLKIVSDILDVAKIESGKLVLDKSNSDVNLLLQNEADYYLVASKEKGVEIQTLFDSSIPSLNVDPEKIRRVLNNLISNALKFTESGGTIILSSNKFGRFVEISVSDNGSGITDEMKAKLFNKYVQLDNYNPSKGVGTGLGLVISKAIIESHGGKIWIEDNEPRGTRFIFTLPLK